MPRSHERRSNIDYAKVTEYTISRLEEAQQLLQTKGVQMQTGVLIGGYVFLCTQLQTVLSFRGRLHEEEYNFSLIESAIEEIAVGLSSGGVSWTVENMGGIWTGALSPYEYQNPDVPDNLIYHLRPELPSDS